MSETTIEKKTSEPKILRLVARNNVQLSGRLVRDAEIKTYGDGKKMAQFQMAVSRRYRDTKGDWQEEVSFITVVVWNAAAERCVQLAHKGAAVFVEGRLRSETWEGKDGQTRYGVKVQATQVQFLDRRRVKVSSEDIPFGE